MRMKSNMEIFDFELSEEEMNTLRALDTGKDALIMMHRVLQSF